MPTSTTTSLALAWVLAFAVPPLTPSKPVTLPRATSSQEVWAANLIEAYSRHEYVSFTVVVETTTRTSTPANVKYEESSRFQVRMGRGGRLRTELMRDGRCVWTMITNGTTVPSVMEWNRTQRTLPRALPAPPDSVAKDGTIHAVWLREGHSGCDAGGLIRNLLDPGAVQVKRWAEIIRSAASIRRVSSELGECIEVDRTNDPIAEILHLDLDTGLVLRWESVQYPQEQRGQQIPFMGVRRTFHDISFSPIPDDAFEFGAEDDRNAGKEVWTGHGETSTGD